MTHCLIIGAAGMLGAGLADALLAKGVIAGKSIAKLTLFDLFEAKPRDTPVALDIRAGDLSMHGTAEALIESRPEVIYHLAAIVSGEAERDFEKGYRINLDGTRHLLEAIRQAQTSAPGYRPRFVFASSLAVFGSPLPDMIPDDHILTPRSSYGTQKAIGELLLADHSRRGFIDGIGIRLPTICIRPGKPNAAASGFFSGILREPLAGEPAILPVATSVRHRFASPRAAIGYLVHAAEVDAAQLAENPNLTMPGVSATVADEIEALRKTAGDEAVALIKHEPDPAIEAIISTWPKAFDTKRALSLGFVPDVSFEAIVEAYLEDHASEAR